MSTQTVLYKARRLLGDMGEPVTMQQVSDGIVIQFELPRAPVEPTSVQVAVSSDGGNSWSQLTGGVDFFLDWYNGVIRLGQPAPQGYTIAVNALAYDTFVDTDLLDFISIAFEQHNHHRQPPVVLDPVAGAMPPTMVLPAIEENLVAILAVIEALWADVTAKARNFTIDTGDGTVIPLGQQYEQIMRHIEALQARYEKLANLVGVGLWAIEVFKQRRVSRQTGFLVPVYRDREIEESWWPPDRAMPNIPQLSDTTIHYRGIFVMGQQYNVNDEVTEGGFTYVCTAPNINIDPASDCATNLGWAGLYWKKSRVNEGMFGYAAGYGW